MNSTPLKHARIITKTPRKEDPTIADIDIKSYHEDLASEEQQIQQSIKTSKATLGMDLINCTKDLVARKTSELDIKIKTNAAGDPDRIIKTWTIKKEFYGR